MKKTYLCYTITQKNKGKKMIQKNEIISKLKELKPLYSKEGFIIQGLFGSYSRDEATENSDIDIAIVLSDNENHTFETDVKLMVIRKGDETIIEPHAFSKNEFNVNIPIVNQILQHGERLKI